MRTLYKKFYEGVYRPEEVEYDIKRMEECVNVLGGEEEG